MTIVSRRPAQLTVLIVDDVPPVLAWARRAFARAGWAVLTATDGISALELWDAHAQSTRVQPHLLITDVGMPGMNGTELALRLRERASELPIIVMSGLPADEVAWGVMPHDRSLFLKKPVSGDALVAAAEGLVACAYAPLQVEDVRV